MIIFLHVPGFYAAVEQADHPALRGRAVVVGGDPRKRGAVTSASVEAREGGISEGMELREVRERWPETEFRPTRLPRYREASAEVRAILREVTQRVEAVGLDRFYLEPPERAEALSLAAELCVRLKAELALEVVAGIGPTRFVSYLASRHHAAGEIRQVLSSEVEAFLSEFPLTEIWGLGPSTAEKLAQNGIHKIVDLRQTPLVELERLVGRSASTFHNLARGADREPLRPSPGAKSLSQERTLPEPSVDLRTLGDDLLELAAGLETMLARERRAARTVSLGLRYVNGDQVTRTRTLQVPIHARNEIGEVALELLARTQAGARQCRRLRLQVTNLCRPDRGDEARQLRLF